MLGVAEDI